MLAAKTRLSRRFFASGGGGVLELLKLHAQWCAATAVSAKISFTIWTATMAMQIEFFQDVATLIQTPIWPCR